MARWFHSILLLIVAISLTACGGPGPEDITVGPDKIENIKDQIVVTSEGLRTVYERKNNLSTSLMVFGGHLSTGKNAHHSLTLIGLPMNKAHTIHNEYPDFHKCNSPGADLAKKHTIRMDLVVNDLEAMDLLVKTINRQKEIENSPAERITVKMNGESLTLSASVIKGTNKDISNKLRPSGPITQGYMLVESADQLDTKKLLDG